MIVPADKFASGPFRSAALSNSFARDGFVVVDLLEKEEIDSVARQIAPLIPRDVLANDPFDTNYVSYFDQAIREEASALIGELVGTKLTDLLDNYRLLFATTFVKPPLGAETPIHQHSPYVSSMHSLTIGCWCPLVDCPEGAGAFQVVRGGHCLSSHVQSPSRPMWWQECAEVLKADYLETIEVRAGQAVLFDDSIPHGAGANGRNSERIALLATLVPEASVTAIVDSDETTITAYEVSHPFAYSDLFNGKLVPKEELRAIETLDEPGEMLSVADLRERLARRGIHANQRPAAADKGRRPW
jgi:hypothetical protein